MAAGGDVSQIVLQMTNATTQLVIDPLFRCGVLFFKGGVRGDVLRRFFSPKDLFRKQIKAGENKKG
jgi:stalled ribosome alternative rescue factor ArfA